MPIQEDRQRGVFCPGDRNHLAEIRDKLVYGANQALLAFRAPVPPTVVAEHKESALTRLTGDVFIALTVLSHAVQQDNNGIRARGVAPFAQIKPGAV